MERAAVRATHSLSWGVGRNQVIGTSSWPILVLACPPKLDAAWIEELQSEFRDVFARERRFALITDTSAIRSIPNARERKAVSEWAGRPDQLALQKLYNVGSTTIITNPVIRGMLQALTWIWTPATPQHVAGGFDESWVWCLRMLEERGIPLTTPAHELRTKAEQDLQRLRAANETRESASPRP